MDSKRKAKIDSEIKKMRDTPNPKLRNIFKEIDGSKHKFFLVKQIRKKKRDNPKEDSFVIKIIKNIGKKKPPKNMTIMQ